MTTALVLGATGLVGHLLMPYLLQDERIDTVIAPTRHALAKHPKLINPIGADIFRLLEQIERPIDLVFCCLGTTIRDAGNRHAFKLIDQELPVYAGKIAQHQGAQRYLVISALGSSARSLTFYNRVKYAMEQELEDQRWQSLIIARPSMLLGSRSKPRILEQLTAPIFKLFPGRWKAIHASDVAYALWQQAFQPQTTNITILESDRLRNIAAKHEAGLPMEQR